MCSLMPDENKEIVAEAGSCASGLVPVDLAESPGLHVRMPYRIRVVIACKQGRISMGWTVFAQWLFIAALRWRVRRIRR